MLQFFCLFRNALTTMRYARMSAQIRQEVTEHGNYMNPNLQLLYNCNTHAFTTMEKVDARAL